MCCSTHLRLGQSHTVAAEAAAAAQIRHSGGRTLSAAYTGAFEGLQMAVQGQRRLAASLLDCSTVNCITTTEEAGTNSFLAGTTHDHAMRMEPDKDPKPALASPHSA